MLRLMVPSDSLATTVRCARPESKRAGGVAAPAAASGREASAPIAARLPDCRNRLRFIGHLAGRKHVEFTAWLALGRASILLSAEGVVNIAVGRGLEGILPVVFRIL